MTTLGKLSAWLRGLQENLVVLLQSLIEYTCLKSYVNKKCPPNKYTNRRAIVDRI